MKFFSGIKPLFSSANAVAKPLGAPIGLVAYGDSTTYGDELDKAYGPGWQAYRWTTLLGTDLRTPINNRGMNGHKTEQIAARAGGLRMSAIVTGGLVPASGPVHLTDLSVTDPLALASSQRPYPMLVDLTVSNGTTIRGRIQRIDRKIYSFSRMQPGAEEVASKVDVVSFTGYEDMRFFAIIGAGTNDEPGDDGPVLSTEQMDYIKDCYRALVSTARNGFLCWGPLDRGYRERAGTPNGDFIRELEGWLRTTYGPNFVDVRGYLASSRAITDAAILQPGFVPQIHDDPQINDIASVDANTIPPSFRFGGVHVNGLGHALTARLFSAHLRSRFSWGHRV